MGNKTVSTKYKVLELLRAVNAPVSGESIAEQTGVSRVSVWKAVQSLQSAGYGITSAKNGYQLSNDLEDSLYPWEFGKEEQLFAHFDETDSTMQEARKIAESENNSDKPQIVTADKQTNGYGQNNRSWTTTKGSLAYTVITRSHLPVAASHRIVMAAQVALANVLSKETGRRFYVRWPNDIWSDNGKVCGVLDELSASGSICKWINVGVGINMTAHPRIPLSDCVLTDGIYITRKQLLSSFIDEFQKQEKNALSDSSKLSDEWNSLCCDIGKELLSTDNREKIIFNKINGWGWAEFSSLKNDVKKILPPGTIRFNKEKINNN